MESAMEKARAELIANITTAAKNYEEQLRAQTLVSPVGQNEGIGLDKNNQGEQNERKAQAEGDCGGEEEEEMKIFTLADLEYKDDADPPCWRDLEFTNYRVKKDAAGDGGSLGLFVAILSETCFLTKGDSSVTRRAQEIFLASRPHLRKGWKAKHLMLLIYDTQPGAGNDSNGQAHQGGTTTPRPTAPQGFDGTGRNFNNRPPPNAPRGPRAGLNQHRVTKNRRNR